MGDTRGVARLGMPHNQRPESKDLQRFLTDYCEHWRATGLHLGLKASVLNQVEVDHHTMRERFRVTLEKWLQLNVGVTWGNLELAITNANRESLGLQPLTTVPSTNVPEKLEGEHSNNIVPTSWSEVTVAQSDDNQSSKDDETSQVESYVTDDVVECVEVKKQFRAMLVTKLQKTYLKVVKKLMQIFEEKKVDVEQLITLLRFNDVDKKSVFSTDEVYTSIRTEKQLFRYVAKYCKSIYDYQVLDALIEVSECPEAIKELTDFTESLRNSVLTELDLMSEHGELLHPDDFMPGTYKFIIEYVGGKCTIETKEMVQGIVEQSVRLKKGVLIFKGVDVGSILFIYQISEAVKNYLLQYKFTEEDVTFLEGNNITSLIVDGVRIMSSSQPNKEPQESFQLTNMILKQLDKLDALLNPESREATFSVLKRIFDNIVQHPNDDKYHQIKLTSKTFSSKVWQYPAGEELMKMSGWVVEDDHVRLRDDSCVQIVSQLLKSFLSSSATGVVPLPDDEFQVLIKALYNGDVACIQKLLKASHISPNGRIYSESGSSLNLFMATTIAQQIDIVKLLLTDYSMDPYVMSMKDDKSFRYIEFIFGYAPQSFIIAIMKYCGVKSDFKTTQGYSLLHIAVMSNCFDVICFLLEECSDIDVNVTNSHLYTPLHVAYIYGHTQIAQYLIEHGANELAVDSNDCTPYEYIDGDSECIKALGYLQNRRRIYHIPFSIEHCYYMKLVNLGIDDKKAISLTMEQFPLLKEDGPTQPHHDIDHASGLKEFTQFITNSTQRSSDDSREEQPPSEVQEGHVKISTDYPWTQQLSVLKSAQFLS